MGYCLVFGQRIHMPVDFISETRDLFQDSYGFSVEKEWLNSKLLEVWSRLKGVKPNLFQDSYGFLAIEKNEAKLKRIEVWSRLQAKRIHMPVNFISEARDLFQDSYGFLRI
ncbi:hypothetical protein AVEN_204973-1 [Araneus ventricosus]|uniref:Uncharacterized protein n=1 Tax=Araneus ventricosus TaxID=182803 RepID=A0A4Y2S2S3_ARAVE|nr:hypothetical protein AVEN_204973-1 [Araneus ventricosus]